MSPPVPEQPVTADAIREILAVLNALSLGELSRVYTALDRAEAGLQGFGAPDLATRVAEGRAALRAGDVKEFRRAVSNVTARLGHLR